MKLARNRHFDDTRGDRGFFSRATGADYKLTMGSKRSSRSNRSKRSKTNTKNTNKGNGNGQLPAAGLKYLRLRNRYDAGAMGRRLGLWTPGSPGPNAAILQDLDLVRSRSRDATRNNGWIKKGINSWVSNEIGTGITPRSLAPDETFRERIGELWDEWTEVADADNVLDFYGLQALASRTRVEGGEIFIRLRPRSPERRVAGAAAIAARRARVLPICDEPGLTERPQYPRRHRVRRDRQAHGLLDVSLSPRREISRRRYRRARASAHRLGDPSIETNHCCDRSAVGGQFTDSTEKA
jgi:hypothetical protein